MNSVYDRPLFANRKQKRRDARTKLLNMGGIVASSPELMQAVNQAPRSMNQGGYVAGYDAGGHVHPHTRDKIQSGVSDLFAPVRKDVGRLGSAVNFLNSGLANTGALGMDALSMISAAMGLDTGAKQYGDRAAYLRDLASGQNEKGGETLLAGIDVSAIPGLNNLTAVNAANAEVVDESDAETIEDLETTPGPKTLEIDARQAELLAETRQKLADAELLLKNKKLSEDAKADAAADLVGKGLQGTDKERAAQYKDLIEDVFGKKASANTIKGLNKQLIGFTIAAGKSPRAVQNIAAGMIAGAKTEKADIAKEQERTDAMSTLALNQMFSEKAASELAASNLAVAKARGTGEQKSRQEIIYGTTFQSFVNSMQDANQRARDNFQTPPYTDEEIIATARRAAMDAAPGSISAKADITAGRGAPVDVSKTAGNVKLSKEDAIRLAKKAIASGENPEKVKEQLKKDYGITGEL